MMHETYQNIPSFDCKYEVICSVSKHDATYLELNVSTTMNMPENIFWNSGIILNVNFIYVNPRG